MSFDPTQRQVSDDVTRSMDLFQRARVGSPPPMEPARPQRVLLVLDGSGQDETSVKLTESLVERFSVQVTVMDARDHATEPPLAETVATRLGSSASPRRTGDSFQQIIDQAAADPPDLIIVPCPYGRDLEAVGPDSAGTVIDVLLAHSPAPLLVVRQTWSVVGPLFPQVVLLLSRENEAASSAGAWAMGMTATGGSLTLLLVLEREFYQNVRDLVARLEPHVEVTPAALEEALTSSYARLHRRLQLGTAGTAIRYQLVAEQEDAPLLRWDDPAQPVLLVVALERGDHGSQGHVQDYIRRSPHPVLVVPRLG